MKEKKDLFYESKVVYNNHLSLISVVMYLRRFQMEAEEAVFSRTWCALTMQNSINML